MTTLFVTLVLLGASVPAAVSSDPSCMSECNKKGTQDPKENQMSWMGNGDIEPLVIPAQGHFHVWSLVSDLGNSLLKLSQDKGNNFIECSGSFDQNPVQFQDTSVYPTSSLTIKLQASLTRETYYLSIHEDTKAVVLKDPQQEPLDDYDRLIPWLYRGFVMLESKPHQSYFLGCTKEGAAQLFHVRDKRHPDPRTLFVINNVVPNLEGN